jgi:serine/threonine-protein kinase
VSRDAWGQAFQIFERAVAESPENLQAFLDEACHDDPILRRTVEELLAADRETDSFLDRPVLGPTSREDPEQDSKSLGEPDPAGPPNARGARIGPYRVLRRIGKGGMSLVYLAVRADDAFQRRVVLKLLRPGMESQAIQQRMRTERQILASLDHPYIAHLYDGGTTDAGLPYFVLEFVEGVPLDVFCEQNRLTVDERLTLFRKVCSAVHYAHQNLVVHRDLKPSNILVTAEGDPRLLDFGIAKLLNPELQAGELEPTATWHQILTPNYASPEQVRGKLITTASDVYSLGVLLYKILTGHLPHRLTGLSPQEIETVLTESEPLPPSHAVTRPVEEEVAAAPGETAKALRPDGPYPEESRRAWVRKLAGDLDAIALKALRSTPQRRYSSVEHMSADIERFQLGLAVEARAGSWRYHLGKFVRRNRRAVAAATVVALVLASFAVAMALQASRVLFERDQARQERDKKAQVLSLILEIFELSNPYVLPGNELTVREALERSLPILEDGLREQPEVRAELLHTAGSILGVLGLHEVAREPLEEALAIRQQLYGDDHPDVAASLSALAAAYKELGELDRAEELARRAVTASRSLVGTGPDQGSEALLGSLNELVSVLCYRNEYGAAEESAQQALAMTRGLPSGNVRRTAALEHLARIRSAEGNYREAARLNGEALARRRARYGEDHPGQISVLNNLGLNLRRLGDLESAERHYLRALELLQANFGAEHLDPYLLNNLASIRLAREDHSGAEEAFRQAREAVLSINPDHWMVFHFEVRLALVQIRQGQAAQAEAALRTLLDLWRPRLGDHWRIADARSILGESLSAQGRCAEAEPLMTESFEKILQAAKQSTKQDAFERLRQHFERCGESQKIPAFEAMLEASTA